MIDWLRGAAANPVVEVAGRSLPIALRRHPRARRLTMRLAPTGDELRITLPTWGRTQDALTFARSRVGWIEAQLARVPAAPEPLRAGGSVPFRGELLLVDWHETARRTPQRDGAAIRLGGPQTRIGPRIQRWLEGEALALMAQDLACYCERAGHPAPAIALSRAQRRWGSCASAATRAPTIRINWRLVMAPDHVRRSVVAHEVAHLTHFDHSPAFHAHLAGLFEGNLAAADDWLRCEGRGLYTLFG